MTTTSRIDYDEWHVIFSREVTVRGATRQEDYIKISRGEENIFIWCFFLAIAQLAIDKDPAYDWVKYIYVDDPISSLDDNNAIAVACHLAKLIKESDMKVVVSTHHALFFNVMYNELRKDNTAFHGFNDFSACIKQDATDLDGAIHLRMTNLLSHGAYSIFEPIEMVDDNKRIFKEILSGFMETYKFNEELFNDD